VSAERFCGRDVDDEIKTLKFTNKSRIMDLIQSVGR